LNLARLVFGAKRLVFGNVGGKISYLE